MHPAPTVQHNILVWPWRRRTQQFYRLRLYGQGGIFRVRQLAQSRFHRLDTICLHPVEVQIVNGVQLRMTVA